MITTTRITMGGIGMTITITTTTIVSIVMDKMKMCIRVTTKGEDSKGM